MKKQQEELLDQVSDKDLIDYCAKRLLKEFRRRIGCDFRYGEFRWVIHEGVVVQVDGCPKFRSYRRDRGLESE